MNALLNLARRGHRPRQENSRPERGSAPAAERDLPRLGHGATRDRTPSPAPHAPWGGGPPRRRRIDPRWYQILMLSSLLAYGVFGLHFELGAGRIAAVIGAALATQAGCGWWWRLPRFDPLSALISGIGLCTLLRTDGALPGVLAAVIAIASKFVLRVRGKHLYNPTNLALVIMLVAGQGWISPGQYGHIAFVALLMVCLGLTVVCKAGRFDVTLAFLAVYAAILFGRSLWLGEPLRIPLHRLQSGLLLQFAFNMISDPRTTPDTRAGRLLFGALVAIGAGIVQFVLFRTNGPVWSLAACTLLVPLIDRWLPGPRHQWNPAPATAGITSRRIVLAATAGAPSQGDVHEAPVPVPASPAVHPLASMANGDRPADARGPLARHRP